MADKNLNSITFPGLPDKYKVAQVADEYSSSSTYAVGDIVNYLGTTYRCTTAITTAENWTVGHWTTVKIADEVTDLKSAFVDETLSSKSGVYYKTDGTIGTNSSWCSLKARIGNVFTTGALVGTGSVTYYSDSYPSIVYTDDNGNVLATRFTNSNITSITLSDVPSGAVWILLNGMSSFSVNNVSVFSNIESVKTIAEESANNFPFTADSKMKRSQYNDGAIDGNVIKNLFIYDDTNTYKTLYISNLFQNSTKQEVVIKDEDGLNFARYQKVASPSTNIETGNFLRYNSAGTAVTNTICGRITVDWSKLDATLVSCVLGDFNILDCCILRKSDLQSPVVSIATNLIAEKINKFPFTNDSTLVTSSGTVDPLAIKNIYVFDNTGSNQPIYVYSLFKNSSKKEIQINLADGTPYCGAKDTVNLSANLQTLDLYKYSSGTNLSSEKVGTITIDWATNPYVVGAGSGSFILLDCVILRSSYVDGNNEWLPMSTYYVSSVQQRLYFNEIFNTYQNGFMVVTASGATYPEVTYTDRYIEFNVTTSKTITLILKWYVNGKMSTSKSISVVCNTSEIPTTKIICIGDSWTYDGNFEKWIADNNSNVTFYGTITSQAGTPCEGRYGWTVEDYFANTTKNGQTNPFYNPSSQTFDFSYYIAQNPTYSDVDVVNLLLGMNNAFDDTIINGLLTMADSIKSYNNSIKVTIMLAPQLASDNSGAGRYMQNVHVMNDKFFHFNVSFLGETIDSGIYLIHPCANIDSVYDYETETVDSSVVNNKQVTLYTNNVHPATAGYKKIGIAYNGWLRNILN